MGKRRKKKKGLEVGVMRVQRLFYFCFGKQNYAQRLILSLPAIYLAQVLWELQFHNSIAYRAIPLNKANKEITYFNQITD